MTGKLSRLSKVLRIRADRMFTEKVTTLKL